MRQKSPCWKKKIQSSLLNNSILNDKFFKKSIFKMIQRKKKTIKIIKIMFDIKIK
jgi:hypothetical protein